MRAIRNERFADHKVPTPRCSLAILSYSLKAFYLPNKRLRKELGRAQEESFSTRRM